MSLHPFKHLEDVSLSVVVPVFNEGDHVDKNLSLLENELENYFHNYEIIVISDGSTDQTNEKIKSFKSDHLRSIIFEQNQGKGVAVRRGFAESKGDFILFIDGGMELHPREIKIFLGLMYLYDADIVIGSKRHPQSNVFYPWYRRILSQLFQFFVKVLFHINVTDTQVGIKMFRRELIKKVLPHLATNTYGFDLEILALAAKMGHSNILEAPVRLDYFLKNKHSTFFDLIHTAKVGLLLSRDTLRLWYKLKSIKV